LAAEEDHACSRPSWERVKPCEVLPPPLSLPPFVPNEARANPNADKEPTISQPRSTLKPTAVFSLATWFQEYSTATFGRVPDEEAVRQR
jgi:hypothetical protein